MEAAVDRVRALRLSERGGAGRVRGMADRQARGGVASVPGDAVLEIFVTDAADGGDPLSARAEGPFEHRRSLLAAAIMGAIYFEILRRIER